MRINFVKNNRLWLLLTLVIVGLSLGAIYIWSLRFGIDFKGGTIIEYKFSQGTDLSKLEDNIRSIKDIKYSHFKISNNTYQFYFEPLSEDQKKALESELQKDYKGATRVSIETISSSVGTEQSIRAVQAVALASLTIIVFLTFAFRRVPKPFSSWEFGVSAVLALLHDALVVLGVFAILGHFLAVEIDTQFITAILTVIGFSVHDTIVVFDRIRENTTKSQLSDYRETVNDSLVETLARSVNLTVTAVLVLLALFILGPIGLRWFTGALLIGMVSGTYSSIFVASQILIAFQELKAFVRAKLPSKKK